MVQACNMRPIVWGWIPSSATKNMTKSSPMWWWILDWVEIYVYMSMPNMLHKANSSHRLDTTIRRTIHFVCSTNLYHSFKSMKFDIKWMLGQQSRWQVNFSRITHSISTVTLVLHLFLVLLYTYLIGFVLCLCKLLLPFFNSSFTFLYSLSGSNFLPFGFLTLFFILSYFSFFSFTFWKYFCFFKFLFIFVFLSNKILPSYIIFTFVNNYVLSCKYTI